MDLVTKAYAYDGTVRIYVATSTDLVNKAQKLHHLWPTSTAALGRTLTMAAIMGLSYYEPVDLTIRIDGGGPLGEMVVLANEKGEVRGYVSNPEVFMEYNDGPNKGKLNVGMAVGTNGFINVTKDLKLRTPFTSTAELQTGEIAEDFTYYYALSEQIPSSVGLGVLVDTDNSCIAAGGFLLQLMPGYKKETVDKIEEILQSFGAISEMIQKGRTHEDIIKELSNNNYEILETRDISYKCDCSKERFAKGIKSLDIDTIDSLIEDGHASVSCHFCQSKYEFSKQDLEEIKNQKTSK